MKIFILRNGGLFAITTFFVSNSFFGQQNDSISKQNQLQEVAVKAIRANLKTPIAFTNFSKYEIEARNLGQDIPVLLQYLPSVVTTSDAGNGFGYTGLRVRGTDATRINVTINGIPYNDAESQGTFWVNMPDFASSLENIQLQRGVGTSTNGGAAFGASLNMLTGQTSNQAFAEISNSYGSFNSRKHTLQFGTGVLNTKWSFLGRFSKLYSDGFIDRASSNLKSYYLQADYLGKTTTIKALVFGGKEKTYQAWYGVDKETLAKNRTFNAAGQFTDTFGQTQFYENQTDNYTQDHCQLHWNEKISESFQTNFAVHYTKGKGFYEEFNDNAVLNDFNLPDFVLGATTISNANLITQKWLDNDFYGFTFSGIYSKNNIDFVLGGGLNKYNGKHFGEVIWSEIALVNNNLHRFYNNNGNKIDGNIFAKLNYEIGKKWNLFADLQIRNVIYKASGVFNGKINEKFTFFNPKTGITYKINNQSNTYFSVAIANREPNRTDFENGTPKPEKLFDYEVGYRLVTKKFSGEINVFYMNYKNQLVLTGALDLVGNPIRENSGKSYRSGIEVSGKYKLNEKWYVFANFSINENKNKNYLNDSFQNLGNTYLPFSPKFNAATGLDFLPIKNLKISWINKYVSSQYLSNLNTYDSKLYSYFVNDLVFNYDLKLKNLAKKLQFSVLANNIFNQLYESNGADYGGGYVVFFPQAGANFLASCSVRF